MGEATFRNSLRMSGAGLGIAALGLLPALRSPHTDVRALGWGLILLGVSITVLSILGTLYDHHNRD